jgi:hypothetical protein
MFGPLAEGSCWGNGNSRREILGHGALLQQAEESPRPKQLNGPRALHPDPTPSAYFLGVTCWL